MNRDAFGKLETWRAVLASASAPTYLPHYKIDDMDLVDGGVTMNNPAEYVFNHMYYH